MTSTIKVNNIQNQCGANIINESSNTITIGASGDTVALASGASQTGFGRSGSVNWQTGSIKTSGFTAANGEGYFCNTSGGAFTVTLPASPSAGDIVAVADYTRTFGTNNLTIGRNSEPIGGVASDATLDTDGQSATFVYVDGTEGWINVTESTGISGAPPFIIATGGTITTSGDCKIHTFTGPGTFSVTAASCTSRNAVSYMVIAGGGSGGSAQYNAAGGGGAGGYRETKSPITPYTASPLCGYATPGNRITVTSQGYPIVVGGGGASVTGNGTDGNDGNNSSFSTITSTGGGAGTAGNPAPAANPGGSGGGAGGGARSTAGGSGNTPPVTPPQGNNGGPSAGPPSPNDNAAGGGGGAAAVGGAGSTNSNAGGCGTTSSINGTPTARAGGGGGSGNCGPVSNGSSAPGGGGAGGAAGGNDGVAGTANTGGGGGGASGEGAPGGNDNSGAGGSGIVIIRYKFQ
jgi:hypothetical protein